MIALLDTSEDLAVCESELGCDVGELFTPLTSFAPKRPKAPFAIDNGAFSRFDGAAFLSLLERHRTRRDRCLFVAAPDVVGSARRTREVFDHWYPRLAHWPIAFVAQDGVEDLPIPWELVSAVFIGGSTKWKMSAEAAAVVRAAKAIGKWVHFGRVNTPSRFEYAEEIGCDSIDGTGLSRYSHMREAVRAGKQEPCLFTPEPPGHGGAR